ncbi:MAG: hypothetical protein IJ600_01500 [Lachnospiraceae bacterium]|nr:hypothetical protein [Lachnospiraceae bacterium]
MAEMRDCQKRGDSEQLLNMQEQKKNRLCMAEYQGRCDENGTAVGHAPKVLGEYHALIRETFSAEVFAPRCILEAADVQCGCGAKVLPHHIVMKGHPSLFEKIWNKVRMFSNIHSVFRHTGAEKIWFFNTEFYLMLYLALFGNHGKQIFCTMFLDGYHGGFTARIKQRIFERAQKKMRCIIATGPQLQFKNARQLFLPDYAYDEAVYGSYRAARKEEMAVCLGTMGAEKEIEALVECFTRNGYPLHIAGRFYDKERVERLRKAAGKNILIEDVYLSRGEYLTLLGKARYVVLPYRPAQYGTQTSGVLQEAVFLDTIPVSYEKVLSGNGIPGIGFADWEELTAEKLRKRPETAAYAQLREGVYSRQQMKNALEKLFLE